MAKETPIKLLFIILPFLEGIFCSVGDKSPFYYYCVQNCITEKCYKEEPSKNEINLLGFPISLWTCKENCEYECQWEIVEAFQSHNWSIPQFKGKWPFIRIFGLQEPASVFFSVINFIFNFKLLLLFREKVSKTSPFYYVWNIFALLQLNSWFWSSVYHSKDNSVTEKLDYMSAFLVVLYSLYGVGLRYINSSINIKTIFWTVFCSSLCLNHLAYLWLYKFDYGYNMKLNCAIGGLTLILWTIWTYLHFQSQPFVWKIFAFVLLMILSIALELMDFPPIFWIFDAHSLWHSSSIIVNIFFYKFIIDDCNFLSQKNNEKIY